MIAYIRGRLEYVDLEEGMAVLETGGIGYQILLSGRDLELLPSAGEEVRLYSGIGPKGALGILSGLSADDLRFAVLADDAKTIAKAPGIGLKTAKKLILELRDKLSLEEAFEARLAGEKAREGAEPSAGLTAARNEAVEALTALGYSSSEALKAVRQVEAADGMDVEEILKAALKYMSF